MKIKNVRIVSNYESSVTCMQIYMLLLYGQLLKHHQTVGILQLLQSLSAVLMIHHQSALLFQTLTWLLQVTYTLLEKITKKTYMSLQARVFTEQFAQVVVAIVAQRKMQQNLLLLVDLHLLQRVIMSLANVWSL